MAESTNGLRGSNNQWYLIGDSLPKKYYHIMVTTKILRNYFDKCLILPIEPILQKKTQVTRINSIAILKGLELLIIMDNVKLFYKIKNI